MIYILKKGNSLEDIVVYTDEDVVFKQNLPEEAYELFSCFNEEDLFLKLLNLFPKEPYWLAIEILNKFNISASKDFLIKSYCSKSSRLKYYNGDDLYLIANSTNDRFNLEILAICTYYEYNNYIELYKDYVAIKIKKETLPFYLSLFLNRFTAKDFYFCFKNITGIKNIPVISYNSSEFYLVKNRNKIISYHISEDIALKTLNLINGLNDENNRYFNTSISKVDTYEELISSIDNTKIQKSSDFDRYMIDYDWYFDYCISKKHIDVSNLTLENDVYLIRDKSGETITKENQEDMYNYIKDNKLYSEDIFYFRKSDIDFKDTNKYFNLLTKEFSHDDTVSAYLINVDYLKKVKILNRLLDKIINSKSKENILYSLISYENISKLYFFDDSNFFHKHITSLEDGESILSHGELDISTLRRILEPVLKNRKNTNKVFSRADVAFNISNLFKENSSNEEYLKPLKNMSTIIDVDAYLKENKSSCGVVIRNKNNEILVKIARKLDATTSVEAEIKGAMYALHYISLLEPDLAQDVCIRYDCFSVADYLVSEATSDTGKMYKQFVKEIIDKNPNLNIYIKKVRGHSSDFFNDIAHSLAGNFYNY